MAITEGTLLELSMVSTVGSNKLMNVWGYEVTGTFSGIAAVNVAEAWWNAVKTNYRALVYATAGWVYTSVLIRELNNPAGELAEFTVPTGEQQGTRTAPAAPDFLPIFNAVGMRLTVSTRATRPGQKRIWGLTESDNDSNLVSSTFLALVNTLGNQMDGPITLLSPALGMDLQPVVFRKDVAGAVTAHQNVTGHVTNSIITSQVSRRLGRGI